MALGGMVEAKAKGKLRLKARSTSSRTAISSTFASTSDKHDSRPDPAGVLF